MKRSVWGACVVSVAVATAFGVQVEVPVANEFSIAYKYGTNTLVATTQKQATALDGLPTPIFWFDCADTTGWEFEAVNGTNFVTKIPNKTGDGRFLTTDVSLEGTSWKGWSSTRSPKPPVLRNDDLLASGPMLDFGPNHSDQGMVFSPHVYDEAEGATSELRNIGSIVAVWGSANGGGYILGGWGTGESQYFWCRGWETIDHASDSDEIAYYCPVFGSYCGDLKNGIFMSDGQTLSGASVGLNGTWQVAAIQGSTTMRASLGLGLGDVRTDYHRNGGCQFAEMMIFGEQLSEGQLRKVSAFLMEKWLGRKLTGWNGKALLDRYSMTPYESTFEQPVSVPQGEALTIRQVLGGRHATLGNPKTKILESGEGTFGVTDASTFGAPIRVGGGTLALGVKPAVTGTTNDLPFGVYCRFDASETDSMRLSEEDGVTYIERMDNLGFGKYYTRDWYLTAPACQYRDLRPMLIGPSYGSRLPLVYMSHRNADGRYFNSYYDTAAGVKTRQSIPNVVTVFAVVSAALGGGHLSVSMLQRNNRWIGDDSYDSMILQQLAPSDAKVSYTNAVLWIDGRRVAPTSGYPDAGTHVLAVQLQVGNSCTTIGAENYYCGTAEADSGAHGGLIFGEIVFYNRTLSEDEVLQAQAYLMKKWLGLRIPDYAQSGCENIADVQKLVADQSLTIDVPEGRSAMIGQLTTAAPVVKTGVGTLKLAAGTDTTGLTVKGGDVKIVRGTPETADCTYAKGASLHLDASDPDSMLIVERDGAKYVKRWFSKDAEVCAGQTTAANQPVLDETETLNGKTVVKMGTAGWMSFSRRIANTRTVFWVLGSQEGGGQLLGEVYNSPERNSTDFMRESATDLTKPYVKSTASDAVENGEFYQNGVKADIKTALPTGGWELLSLETTDGVQASALATSRGNTDGIKGNQRLAELIIYERVLSAREKVATRNYLAAKWFPERELEELPPEEEVDLSLSVKAFEVGAGETITCEDAATTREILGEGTFVKTGDTTLTVKDISTFEGELDVEEGTVAVTTVPATNSPTFVSEGRVVHFDAQAEETLTHAVESTGSNVISRWMSKVGDIVAIAQRHPDSKATTNMPYYLAHDLNGYPIVDLHSGSTWNDRKCSMGFIDGEGKAAFAENVRTVFWVLGSQEGGGLLLGGGMKDGSCLPYYRAPASGSGSGSEGTNYQEGLFGYAVYHDLWQCLASAQFWVNEKACSVARSSVLSGGYDIVAVRLAEGVADADALNFGGLACWDEDVNRRGYRGHQRLGELIAYDRVLSDEEMAQMQAYLKAKWGYTQKSPVNDVTVNLAADATLTTAGNQYVGKLTGSGTVEGDVTAGTLVAEVGAAGLTVDGTYTIAEGLEIELKGLSTVTGDLKDTVITVLTADAIAGLENLASVVFTGDAIPEGYKAKIRAKDGKLTVTFKPKGMMLLVR